jgi:hypothetical protein
MRFRFPYVAKSPIDLGFLLAEISETPFKVRALAFGTIFIPFLILTENTANARLQRPLFLKTTAKEVDAEWTQFLWH